MDICLYLGIDDCRQNVGTTVIFRDEFYNQPVRSEYDLLCTRVSPSPLPLLSNGFGIHLSSLNKLNAIDGSFKLSGYISVVMFTM
ncbi:DNA mismatch repair protein MLH3-like [Solanum dulcamara]|uniref:DNA mismatch repair protein MLH3-like n=1 Tax=Solanum dulcamara TaxID=45834 RepID=UPI002486B642|nr:DNA mismatch repair protein MLH3-like [Solanum dulcamara]